MQQVKSTMGGVMPNTAIPEASASGSPRQRGHTWVRLLLLVHKQLGLQHSICESSTTGTSPEKGRNAACLPRILLQGCKHLPEEEMLLVCRWQRRKGEMGQLASQAVSCLHSYAVLSPGHPAHTMLCTAPASWHRSLWAWDVTALTPLSLTWNLTLRSRAGGTWRSPQTSCTRKAGAENCKHAAVTLVWISLNALCTFMVH